MVEYILSKINSIPADKVMHFSSGVVLFAVTQWVSIYLAISIVVISAISKELYDYTNKENHTPDVWDAFATILGGLVGLLISLT